MRKFDKQKRETFLQKTEEKKDEWFRKIDNVKMSKLSNYQDLEESIEKKLKNAEKNAKDAKDYRHRE